ncbi:MAG: hypothetical protein U0840_09455 [Gemmataceae bacterium]
MPTIRPQHERRSAPGMGRASLLEVGELPVEELALLAEREGRRPVPIYQAHRWFARRFSSAFRAILTAARLAPGDDFWEAFYRGVDYAGRTVLDPFVGGGTSVVEAARLGASAVGVDIDPVACAITRFELRAAGVPDLGPAQADLQRTVGRRLARYYRTVGPGGEARQVLHGFWVQVVRCDGCRREVEAHPHHQLAYEAEGDRQWAFCRSCHRVHELDRDAPSFRCSGCGEQTDVANGPVVHGRLTCPLCRAEEDLIDGAGRVGRPPQWRLFALETIPDGPPARRLPMTERAFQAASPADQERVRAARRALAGRRDGADGWRWVPDRLIPTEGRSDDRLTRYGYRRYRELFNPRQLLHLSVLAEAIAGLTGPAREALALAFSDHLTTNCMLTQYAFGWRRLAPLFSIRAYRHVCRPVEVNPWLDGTGRGTFPNTVRQVQRAVAFAHAPQVARLDGGFVRSGSLAGRGADRVIHHGDSRALAGVADVSVDLILTDPPYCDNIAYAELSDFFLPWLQGFGLAPAGGPDAAALPANLAARSRDGAAVAAFRQGLGECFAQMRRVLKDSGRLVFSYQHRTAQAWEALAFALATGGWRPVQVFPLLGNSTAGLHQHDGTILWDAVTVCRKGPRPVTDSPLRVSDRQVAAAEGHARAWADRLSGQKPTGFRRADHDNLRRASLVAAALGAFGAPGRGRARPLTEALELAAADPE